MYRKKSNGWFKHFDFIIIDLLCVQFSYVLAYFFRHGLTNLYEVELYRNMALMIEIADLIVYARTVQGCPKERILQRIHVSIKADDIY